MPDYNDPFEQVGEMPVIDWNAAAKQARIGREVQDHVVTSPPTEPCGACEDGCVPGTAETCPRCRGRLVYPPADLQSRLAMASAPSYDVGFEAGVRQAMEWLRADYEYGTGPDWREQGVEWIAERLAEHTRTPPAAPCRACAQDQADGRSDFTCPDHPQRGGGSDG